MLYLSTLARRMRGEEQGVAIVAVVGVMAVGMILASLILTSLISAVSFTSSTRAGVQSQAAAEAGIAAAQAGLQISGDCAAKGGVYGPVTPTPGLEYRATVWVKNSTGNWVRGCPSATATEVKIISTGDARNTGVAGDSAGDESFVEAVFGINIAPIVEAPSPSAVYVGGGASANSLTITSANSQPGDIHILTGNFNCTSGSTINGSIIVGNGNANLTNSCIITGSVKASGSVTVSAAVTIGGDVVAAGGGVSFSNSTIKVGGSVSAAGAFSSHATIDGSVIATGTGYLNAGSLIKGNYYSGGQITELNGKVNGNVTSPSPLQIKINPDQSAVGGQLRTGGTLSTWGYTWNVPSASASDTEKAAYYLVNTKKTYGSILYGQTGITAPATAGAPTVTPWVDFVYKASDWTPSFQIKNWETAQGCEVSAGYWNGETKNTSYMAIANYTTPTLIDARACSNLNFHDMTVKIKTDIVFIGSAFTLGDLKYESADGLPHKLWFLVPDGSPTTAGPQCSNGAGAISTYGGSEIKAPLYALAYTPCNVAFNNGVKWRGQLYSGGFTVSSKDSLVYMPIGIPGTDLTGAGNGGGPSAPPAGLGDLTAIRNRADDGE